MGHHPGQVRPEVATTIHLVRADHDRLRALVGQAVVADSSAREALPSKAHAESGRISVLAPLGTAVLGYRAGDTIEWRTPGGLRRLRVVQVMFQPEAYARSSGAARAGQHSLGGTP